MANITQLTTTLLDFLSTQDKSWSLCTLAFMASFLVFFAIYIGLNRYHQPWTKAYVIAFIWNGGTLPDAAVISAKSDHIRMAVKPISVPRIFTMPPSA